MVLEMDPSHPLLHWKGDESSQASCDTAVGQGQQRCQGESPVGTVTKHAQGNLRSSGTTKTVCFREEFISSSN